MKKGLSHNESTPIHFYSATVPFFLLISIHFMSVSIRMTI